MALVLIRSHATGVPLNRAFASFKYRNYRLWFSGQVVSLVGTWMQNTAQGYYAFELTRSPAFLGWVAFASGMPTWIFMLFAGSIVDRSSKKTVLFFSQAVMMVLAFLMAGLTHFEALRPWHILVLSALFGIANSFDVPARQSLSSELVDKKDLSNALALNGAMFNFGSTVGPAIAGIVYAVYGPFWCFLINGFSFVAVLTALAKIRLRRAPDIKLATSVFADAVEGVRFAFSHETIRGVIAVAAMMSLFGISVVTILPAWATHQLHEGARVSGYLQGARGIGAVCGAFAVAYFSATMSRGRVITAGLTALPLSLLVFGGFVSLPVSLISIAVVGACQILILNLSNSILHSLVEDRMRGRVSSVFSLTFFGLLPVGGLIMGQLAQAYTESMAVMSAAVAFILCAVGILLVRNRLSFVK